MSTVTSLGSYRAESFAISLQDEIRRLNAQVDLFWRVERPLLERAGLTGGMDVLDCGCGPGRLIELLKQTMPSLKCTGLEIDPVLAEAARDQLERRGFADCEVVQGSAEQPSLPAGSFDFIVMRLVLEHLPDPVHVLRQLSKLLRPNGRIAVISNDFEFHLRTSPPVQELDRLYEAYCASRRRDGGDPCIGRRLPQLLTEAGLAVEAFEMEVAHSSLEGDRAFLQAEGSGIPAQLVQSGFLAEEAYQSMVGSWKQMLRTPGHSIMRPLFVGVGRKTPPGQAGPIPHKSSFTQEAQARPRESQLDLDYAPPSTELEKTVAEIWRRAIGLERVGVTNNFFDLGGDSLVIEDVLADIEGSLGRNLSTATLFQHPTVRALAAYLDPGAGPAEPSRAEPSEPLDRIAAQARRRREAAARRRR